MPANYRRHILLAAEEILQDHASVPGCTISLRDVARRSGLPLCEVTSHYPTEQALVIGMIEHTTRRWSDLLASVAGKEAECLTAFERYRIYVTATMTTGVSRANYWIFSDARNQLTLPSAWSEHVGPWLATDGLRPHVQSLLSAARFCAEGALFADATRMAPVDNIDSVRLHALSFIDAAENAK